MWNIKWQEYGFEFSLVHSVRGFAFVPLFWGLLISVHIRAWNRLWVSAQLYAYLHICECTLYIYPLYVLRLLLYLDIICGFFKSSDQCDMSFNVVSHGLLLHVSYNHRNLELRNLFQPQQLISIIHVFTAVE